jgi:hypothetical protein
MKLSSKIYFDQNLPLLEKIFGKKIISDKISRLKEILEITENCWYKNRDRLKNDEVENILIAESPPWSESGTPRYFYNKIESNYHLRIWRTFFPHTNVPSDCEQAYKMLADKKFLLIDTIPYSVKFLSSNRRNVNYSLIVKKSISWWISKLNDEKLLFSKNVKIAFAFRLNGQVVIEATGGKLILKANQIIPLSADLIAADGSNYTSSDKLRNIYQLNVNP